MRRTITIILLFLAAATAALAQSVRWRPSESGNPSDVELVFENATPTGTVQLPTIPNAATVTPIGTQQQTSIGPGGTQRFYIEVYSIRMRNNAPVEIPSFVVPTNRGDLRVPAFRGTTPAQATANIASSSLDVGAAEFWAGEVVPLTYTLNVARRNLGSLETPPEWDSAPFVAEEWPKQPVATEQILNGENRLLVTYKTNISTKTPGRQTLSPVRQQINVQTGSVSFGLLQAPRFEVLSVTSTRPTINVKPLPAGAPAAFNGAVGQFSLTSKVVPEKAAVGEPITWTLTLAGEGNWPEITALPSRNVSRDFQVVQPQAKRDILEGMLFAGKLAEDVVLVPSAPGTYTLPGVVLAHFNPKTSRYETLQTQPTVVTVTGPAITLPGSTGSQPVPSVAIDAPRASAPPPPPPPAPSPIIRDPLPGSGDAWRPLSQRLVLGLASAPFGALILLWLGLAVRRAQQTDPLRSRREAHRRAAAAIESLRTPGLPSDLRAGALRTWQSDSAAVWLIDHAAPSAAVFPDSDKEWARLWAEADRAIYGPATEELPADWAERAGKALSTKPVKSFSPFQVFLRRNLLPVALFFLAAAGAVPPAGAADAIADYRKGGFAAAEKSWRAEAVANPANWVARHNLALALAQQGKGAEAAAHLTAAFVQQPRNESVRWHLAPVLEKAAFTPAPIAEFPRPRFREKVARLASPAEWQFALVAASLLTAASIALWLVNGYVRPIPALRFIGPAAFAAAVVLVAAALWSLRAYGIAGDRRAVIAWRAATLRSIPTEADSTQQTTPLPAGSVGVADNTFLTWQRVVLPGGQTGWIRKSDVVPLW